ncbi:MAG: flagellar biosynthesis protein FlhB [Limnochordia bacterium]|jgi:flagellar biosynthetic protein FlhB
MEAKWRFHLQLFAGEKTEPATPRRRQEARRRGQTASTRELNSALVLLAALMGASFFGSRAVVDIQTLMHHCFQDWLRGREELTIEGLLQLAPIVISLFFQIILPVLLLIMIAGTLAQVVQVGFLFTGEPLTPKLERLNPLAGLQRIFSKRAFVEFGKAILKIGLVGLLAFSQLRKNWGIFPQLIYVSPTQAAITVLGLIYDLGLRVGLLLFVIAILDYAYQRWELEESLKMSKQEIQDEYKEMEGDPQIRSRIRQLQRQMAQSRMMHRIPEADVIITNPVHLAVALSYDPEKMSAPMVIAKGAGPLAERIKEIGREHGVYIMENRPLARTLYEMAEPGQEIPGELYQAVAEVLALVYRLRKKH